MKAREK